VQVERILATKEQIDTEIHRVFTDAKKGATIDKITKELSVLLSGFHITAYCFPKGERFFRAVSADLYSLPTNKDCLQYPPPQVTRLGRANVEGKPVFYCANNEIVAMKEIQPSEGDYLVVGEWFSKERFLFQYIGVSNDALKELGSQNNSMKEIAQFHQKKIEQHTDIDSYLYVVLSQFFIQNRDSSVYSFTAALTNILLERVQQNPRENFLKEYTRIAGIQYPSIMDNGNSMNFAITTNTVDECLVLSRSNHFQYKQGEFCFIRSAVCSESQNLHWTPKNII
jgi:hypothetical protein